LKDYGVFPGQDGMEDEPSTWCSASSTTCA